MIVTRDCYAITDLVQPIPTQNKIELVWASITIKYHYKMVVGAFY